MAGVEADLLPARMINEFAYCPRLFHLEFVDGRWAANEFTVQGTNIHRRIDDAEDTLPVPTDDDSDGDPEPDVVRSVTMSSENLGVIAKVDLVDIEGTRAVPVDTKRGKVPDNPERSHEPERVQIMLQGMLLREHGYEVDHGMLYFRGSRTRVRIDFTQELYNRTLLCIQGARETAGKSEPPPPLEDSPKCVGCSLSGICLPDETRFLQYEAGARIEKSDEADEDEPGSDERLRRLYPARNVAMPMYICEQGAKLGRIGEALVVRKGNYVLLKAPRIDVGQVVLMGNVSITPQALRLLAGSGIPIVHTSRRGWLYAVTSGTTLKNAYDRAAQFEAAASKETRLEYARRFIDAKCRNQRTLLMRNGRQVPAGTIDRMRQMINEIPNCGTPGELLGIEGNVAALYFASFESMLRASDGSLTFDFKKRNRRPPKDPVNAMLSFGYAMLARECSVALLGAGLDPWWGLFHRPRHGRPALALDLMEEFRPLIADSALLACVSRNMVKPDDFTLAANACAMNDNARKNFIRAFEYRMDTLLTHPVFGYQCSWRAMIGVQAQFLARALRGDIPEYKGIITR